MRVQVTPRSAERHAEIRRELDARDALTNTEIRLVAEQMVNGRLSVDQAAVEMDRRADVIRQHKSVIIDKAGVVRYKQIGPLTMEALQQKILPLVRQLQQ